MRTLITAIAVTLATLMALPAQADPTPARFSWPLAPPHAVVRGYEPPDTPYGRGHRGVDLAAAVGTPVLAADAGVVVYAGLVAGIPVVSIDHDGGLRTTYEPVAASVTTGAQVYRGQQIGVLRAGHPGCSAAACLHWGALLNGAYVNPLSYVQVTRVRLKPWDPGDA
ncbi:M23 family metallopeptidase [Labedaea rhizosphaerae]|uniref:Peptidase M23-like protein n=1 Tax=Labedaea rhizosphaerae TaxID=598644 RepID=A0A4R6SBQ2_LABRH|nr:M23 family metallopeptidase [Labedaea rhizosphaerae]TDP97370.1 peptidase M23-like protein [Labedaea rhizosphaerae]